MKIMRQDRAGFTIVELLIVIVVIGILASITVVAYNGVQDRARVSKANSDLASLEKAIMAGRVMQDKTLMQITGSNCTYCGVIPYATAIDRIATASQTNLNSLKAGDPWGNPYLIDENEGEGASPCANHDGIGVNPGHTGVAGIAVPFYQCPG